MKIKIEPNIPKELLLYVAENILNGTRPQYIATEIGEEVYFPILIEDNDIFYHGTSELLYKLVKELGFLCTPKMSGITMTHSIREVFEDFIYITADINVARAWANDRAIIDNSVPKIITIKGKDIIDAGCKAFVDPLYFTCPQISILLKDCQRIKIDI